MFGDVGSSLLEGDRIPGVSFTGLTCIYNFTVEQFSNGSDGLCVVINNKYCLMTYQLDTAVVDFSLRSDFTNINFIAIDDGFIFFNCSKHPRYVRSYVISHKNTVHVEIFVVH